MKLGKVGGGGGRDFVERMERFMQNFIWNMWKEEAIRRIS